MVEEKLKETIAHLYDIGPRNADHYLNLLSAQEWIRQNLEVLPAVYLEPYGAEGKKFCNVIGEKKSLARPEDILIVGAHYDSHKDSFGCNDNGSAIAVLFELAKFVASHELKQTIRFVSFVNEGPPFTRTRKMGSLIYAQECRERGENITGMICLETLGCYLTRSGTRSSFWRKFFPNRGNFLAVIANRESKSLMEKVVKNLDGIVKVTGKVVPEFLPGGKSSDHWSFWKEKFPAVMITDVGLFRFWSQRGRKDTPERIDYQWLAKVYQGLENMLTELLLIRH